MQCQKVAGGGGMGEELLKNRIMRSGGRLFHVGHPGQNMSKTYYKLNVVKITSALPLELTRINEVKH
jgi:predicted methyltransferase